MPGVFFTGKVDVASTVCTGWLVSPHRVCCSPLNMTPFGNRDFTDRSKWRGGPWGRLSSTATALRMEEERRVGTRGDSMSWGRQRPGAVSVGSGQVRSPAAAAGAGRDKGGFSPAGFWGRTALPAPWFWTSLLQNCETRMCVVWSSRVVVLCYDGPGMLTESIETELGKQVTKYRMDLL